MVVQSIEGSTKPTTFAPEERRKHLRLLDSCLGWLEEANQRGEQVVSERLGARLETLVPGCTSGISVDSALDLVFAEQEKWVGASSAVLGNDGSSLGYEDVQRVELTNPSDLNPSDAKSLTERIRSSLSGTCLLMLEAHQRRAWFVLGYTTWESYIRREFGLSRSRSYELLDQARVILAIRDAAPMSGMPDISSRKAARIKPHLSLVVDAIRSAAASEQTPSPDDVMRVVAAVLKDSRGSSGAASHQTARGAITRSDSMSTPTDATQPDRPRPQLSDVIEFIAQLPPAVDVLRHVAPSDLPSAERVQRAADWLARFAVAIRQGDDETSADRDADAARRPWLDQALPVFAARLSWT